MSPCSIFILILIGVVATTPEKTLNQKFLNLVTILNRFFVKFYVLVQVQEEPPP